MVVVPGVGAHGGCGGVGEGRGTGMKDVSVPFPEPRPPRPVQGAAKMWHPKPPSPTGSTSGSAGWAEDWGRGGGHQRGVTEGG